MQYAATWETVPLSDAIAQTIGLELLQLKEGLKAAEEAAVVASFDSGRLFTVGWEYTSDVQWHAKHQSLLGPDYRVLRRDGSAAALSILPDGGPDATQLIQCRPRKPFLRGETTYKSWKHTLLPFGSVVFHCHWCFGDKKFKHFHGALKHLKYHCSRDLMYQF